MEAGPHQYLGTKDPIQPPLLLANSAYRNSLRRSAVRNLRTITFPSISTGAYGYPVE